MLVAVVLRTKTAAAATCAESTRLALSLTERVTDAEQGKRQADVGGGGTAAHEDSRRSRMC